MTTNHIAVPALVFNGVQIHDRKDDLCLTDMWKAQGSDPARKPSEWLRQEGAARFIEFLAESMGCAEVGKSHFGLVKVQKGGSERGATFAHWQIGLAYAKYLSPEFHMWCNTVVRERMEGKPTPAPFVIDETQKNAIGGIVKGILAKQLDGIIPALVSHLLPAAVAGYIASHSLAIADGMTAGEVCDLSKVCPAYPRGVSARVSKRLQMICKARGVDPSVSRLGRVRATLFPTHIVREWLDAEGRAWRWRACSPTL